MARIDVLSKSHVGQVDQSSDIAWCRLVVSFCRLNSRPVMRGTVTQRQGFLGLPILYGLRLLIGVKYPRQASVPSVRTAWQGRATLTGDILRAHTYFS